MGSDGTVGANKEAIKIIAKEDDMYAQAYFQVRAAAGCAAVLLCFAAVARVVPRAWWRSSWPQALS